MPHEHPHIDPDGFRLRGTAPSRIDAFSDVVFGFALTIIVVSQAVPRTYTELHEVILGFLPFASCFLLFVSIWRSHYRFFRRYGLHDSMTLWINFALLFTVLFYVYPMKFLFTFATGDLSVFTSALQRRELMMVYGLGFAAIYLCFTALYVNAWRQRRHLRLNPLETALTVTSIWRHIGTLAVGLICCLLARLLPPDHIFRSGYSFLLLLVWGRSHDIFFRSYVRAARDRTSPEDRDALPHAS